MSWTQEQIDARNRAVFGEGGSGEQPEPAGAVSAAPEQKRSKYGNRKKSVDGILFDSSREAARYIELKALKMAGAIKWLALQPEFTLQPPQGGMKAIKYRADFDYYENGKRVVEDVKGFRTQAYRIKAKMFRAKYPNIDFREIS